MARIAAGGGPTKTMPAPCAGFGEAGILGKKAIAGMDRLRAGMPGRLEDAVGAEIAFARGRLPD